jgi:uncharacterized protein YkwD
MSDEERMKQRLVVIHNRYTAPWDHDQFLHKLNQAKEKTTTPTVKETLEQIIIRREELRPTNVWNGVSSIPSSPVSTQQPPWSISQPESQPESQPDNIPYQQSESLYQLANGTINISKLQTTWLWRVNELREQRGRTVYSLEPLLDKTAAERSETMKKKWVADHRRFAKSAYYAYGEIEQRFSKRGVEFVNVSRATFTENIWRATFRCKKSDCTDDAIEAMRQTRYFYLSEEGKANDAHRRTLIHPLFTVVWLWIAVDEWSGKFYLTTHYGTEIK